MTSGQHTPISADLLETGGAAWAANEGLKLRGRASCGELGASPTAGLDGEEREKAKQAVSAFRPRITWRRAAAAAAALTVLLLLLTQHRQLKRHTQNAVAFALYELDPSLLGRSEEQYPAPHCCRGAACAAHTISGGGGSGGASSPNSGGGGGRVAVVTYLRDDAYLPLLQQLECTLRRSNPGLELALMTVWGELSAAALSLVRSLNITLLYVQPLDFRNTYEARYSRNWLKVRALGLTQYQSVLLVDADVAVVGLLDPLFALPVEFAAAWDQSKWLNKYRTVVTRINGGVFLLRPCAAVEAHMLSLLEQHPKLRFVHSTAEQAFFGWYYRYTGATLPLEWNCQVEQCLVGNRTVGGVKPSIVHYTRHKPFGGPLPGALGHEFLCSSEELARRTGSASQAAAAAAAAAAQGGGAAAAATSAGTLAAGLVAGAGTGLQQPAAGGGRAPAADRLSRAIIVQQGAGKELP